MCHAYTAAHRLTSVTFHLHRLGAVLGQMEAQAKTITMMQVSFP